MVGFDGSGAACFGAGPLLVDDGVIRAGRDTPAALDARILVDDGVSGRHGDSLFGAYLDARMFQASLASIGDKDPVHRAGIASELDDVDERGFVVFFGDHALVDTLGHFVVFRDFPDGKAHGNAQPLADDLALKEYIGAHGSHLARYDLIRKIVQRLRSFIAVGHTGDLGEDFLPQVALGGSDTSQGSHLLCSLSAMVLRHDL